MAPNWGFAGVSMGGCCGKVARARSVMGNSTKESAVLLKVKTILSTRDENMQNSRKLLIPTVENCLETHGWAHPVSALACWALSRVYKILATQASSDKEKQHYLKGCEHYLKIVDNYFKDGGDFHVWKKNPITIDGKPYNLDTIEKQILLKDLAEPRAHFAVNCASIGCPPLKPSAWSAATLDEDFAANARTYFALPGNFSYDAASKTVGISQLFDWYKADFGGTPDKVQKALAPYVPNAEAKKLMESGGATLKYLDYNWKLNDAKGS